MTGGNKLLVELGPKTPELGVAQLQTATAEQPKFLEPPVADEPPRVAAEPEPPPAVVELPVADENMVNSVFLTLAEWLICDRFCKNEMTFLTECTSTIQHVAKALDVLQ